jgi:hypothetical protein
MRPATVFKSSTTSSWSAVAVIGVVAVALLAGAAAAATSPTSRPCPSVALVCATLGLKVGAPKVTTYLTYAKTCAYPGAGFGSTKITFQVDTAASFAAGEKAAGRFGAKIIKVKGLGKAAWTTGLGSIYVFDGHETISILSLALEMQSRSTATAKVEALARKLL